MQTSNGALIRRCGRKERLANLRAVMKVDAGACLSTDSAAQITDNANRHGEPSAVWRDQ